MALIDSYVSYNIPAFTEVFFDISNDRKVNVTLINGNVSVDSGDTACLLPLEKRYKLNKNDRFFMRSKSDSIVYVRGNHNVYRAYQIIGETRKYLFKVFHLNNSCRFYVEKGVKLRISVLKGNSYVKLIPISGEPEILGCRLLGRKYDLPPESTYLVNSVADDSFALEIEGENRGINILSAEDSSLELMRNAHLQLEKLRKSAEQDNQIGPVSLVLGAPNVGKTSFCHFLVNKAAEEGWKPVYIDLDIRRNSNTLPGAVSLVVVDGQKEITGSFPVHMKKILYFGSVDPFTNINLYSRLIFRLEKQLDLIDCDSPVHSGVVIDVCGSIGDNFDTTYQILKHFSIDRVFVIGDDDFFEEWTEILPDLPPSILINIPKIIERRTDFQEKRIRENSIRKYFYGTLRNPVKPCYFEVKFSDIKIFSTTSNPQTEENGPKVRFSRITSMDGIVDHVLGVSQAERLKPFRMLTEIKYFVWVSEINVENGTVILMSPEAVTFTKAILLMGDIKMDRGRLRF